MFFIELRYQALLSHFCDQFEDKIIRDKIRQQLNPRDAFNEAHHFNAKVRKGWFDECLNIKTVIKPSFI